MEQLVYPNPAAYRDKLIRFSTLNHTNYSEVRLVALCFIIFLSTLSTNDQFVCVVGAQGESIT